MPASLIRIDGLTLVPWREGRCLVWYAMIADSTAVSYLASTASSAAKLAVSRKEAKYAALVQRYEFVPVAVKSRDLYCTTATTFLKELGRYITAVTFDVISF